MSRRDIGTDDPRVKVRPGKGSRPRTKVRPDYSQDVLGQVLAVDRGRYRVRLASSIDPQNPLVTAVKARELGRGGVVVGDRVRLRGDLSGKKDTLARIVTVEDRRTALRRTGEDGESAGQEKVLVANAEQLLIVTALADPEPRLGFIDRCLVAAYDGGLEPTLCLTKADLASPVELERIYAPLNLPIVVTAVAANASAPGKDDASAPTARGLAQLRQILTGKTTVLLGHSGVGKSSLVNKVMGVDLRAVGHVNETTGRGRHTSTSSVAIDLPGGGWLVDTPGVRTFGLAHVSPADLLRGFSDLAAAAKDCGRGCTHLAEEPSCCLDAWQRETPTGENSQHIDSVQETQRRRARVESYRRLLAARSGPVEY